MIQPNLEKEQSHALDERIQAVSTAWDKLQKVMDKYWGKDPKISAVQSQDISNMLTQQQAWLMSLTNHPNVLMDTQLAWWRDMCQLWQETSHACLNNDEIGINVKSSKDRRFNHEDWHDKPYFNYLKQQYLIWTEHTKSLLEKTLPEDKKKAAQIDFFVKQWLDAMAPSNFVFSNPDLLRTTLEQGGENLIRGFENFIQDLERGEGNLNIKMTDETAFKIGKNIATTPGEVIFQNDLMQLIQYNPTTKTVYQTPLLIIPPWINKFYILDLREKNSFVKWIVDQGHTVFMISWVNPDERHKDKHFEDYMKEGPLAALDCIHKITKAPVSMLGFCIGGTLLGCTLAYLAAKKDTRVNSATFLASLLDFSEPGELGVFTDEDKVTALESMMKEKGYLDGRMLGATFNMLRVNDLFWSYYINNYLRGESPFPFDLLYWNTDSTNMPYAMHSYYLRNMYVENNLVNPGKLVLNKTKIDLRKITIPTYFIATEQDHITPWKSIFEGAKHLSGPVEFVLGGSGHIAGIINPPSKEKYGFRYHKDKADNKAGAECTESWYNLATQETGSWWQHWEKWLASLSGEQCPKRIPGEGPFSVIQPAPGDYVKKSIFNKE